jgi:hypothetical protein
MSKVSKELIMFINKSYKYKYDYLLKPSKVGK